MLLNANALLLCIVCDDFFLTVSMICFLSLLMQVISVHRATEKFIPLISYITSEKDVQHVEAQCGKILIDVPETSKLRILTGLISTHFLLFSCQDPKVRLGCIRFFLI